MPVSMPPFPSFHCLRSVSSRVLVCVFLSVAFVARPAHADIIQIDFSGTVSGLTDTLGIFPGIANGSTVTGTYRYEDNSSAYDQVTDDGFGTTYIDNFPHDGFFEYSLTHGAVTHTLSSVTPAATAGGGSIFLRNEDGPFVYQDHFRSVTNATGNTFHEGMLIDLLDTTGTFFDNEDLLSNFELSDTTNAIGAFESFSFVGSSPFIRFSIDFTSLTASSTAVPEPSSALLALVGSSLLFRRRR